MIKFVILNTGDEIFLFLFFLFLNSHIKFAGVGRSAATCYSLVRHSLGEKLLLIVRQ